MCYDHMVKEGKDELHLKVETFCKSRNENLYIYLSILAILWRPGEDHIVTDADCK